MTDPRDAAFRILRQWTALTSPPLIPDRPAPHDPWAKLPVRDRAFAFDLVTGVLRWRNTLDAVIASRLRGALEDIEVPVRALLWLGAYQLLIQEGTTDYAAVDTTVGLARRARATVRAAGLINAVLRGITRLKPVRAGSADLSTRAFALDFERQVELRQAQEAIFPDPATGLTAHWAAVRSHPALYVDHLRRIYGDDLASKLLLRNNLRPRVTLRVDVPALDAPASAGLVAHGEAPQFLLAGAGWNSQIEALVRAGRLSPQDPTAARAVRRVSERVAAGDLPEPRRILDLCAGLGTKTLQLARAFPASQVVASDSDAEKLKRLANRAKEAVQKNIQTLLPGEVTGGDRFDLVFADVPCSNTGVMGKRVQSRWRWPMLDRVALASLQRQLIAQAAALANGGTVVYATCSIDPEENEAIVQGFLKEQPGWEAESVLTLPSLPGSGEPHAPHDGGYFAILRWRDMRRAQKKIDLWRIRRAQ